MNLPLHTPEEVFCKIAGISRTELDQHLAKGLALEEFAVCHSTGVDIDAYLRARNTRRDAGLPTFGLSDAELAVSFALGVTPEQYAAAKKKKLN